MIPRLFIVALFLPVFLLTAAPVAADGKIYTESGVAIDGYDPVAYFTDGRPVAGDHSTSAEWNGATWRFASAANREMFLTAPEKYAPQYGGYCAWAVSQGYTAPTDPDAWKIIDGKLYLNYSKSVQARWDKDVPGYIKAGDANWPEIEKNL